MPVCARCAADNPARMRFCGACGAPVDPATSAAGAEERKTVTVLFCDLVGFTARSDDADPEDVRAMLRPYVARVRAEIERYGGTVEKFIGDAVMAVFGAPIAHEDDAERAVRAGLRALDAIDDLNAEHPTLQLAVRVGINTGEAVVTLGAQPAYGEGFVTGDVVNTAARLQTAAPVGAVIVGAATYRATERAIEYAELPAVAVKGKADELPVWQALRARSVVSQPRPFAATPFIGRDDELEVLKRTFTRTVRERTVHLVTVAGEPGAGKSRLVAELAAYVDALPDLVTWRLGRCLPYGEGVTFAPIADIVRTQLGVTPADDPANAHGRLAHELQALVPDAPERAWMNTALAPLVTSGESSVGPADRPLDRSATFAAWRRLFEAMATQRPLILVIEDLHWADTALLDFITELVDSAAPVPVMVLVTARPELYDAAPGWAGGQRNSTVLRLSPLDGAETAQLISALLKQSVLPSDLQQVLIDRSGGNPFYAEELVRLVAQHAGAQRPVTAAGADVMSIARQLPETVHAIVAARLDRLPTEVKRVAQDAAVVGERFSAEAVAALGRDGGADVQAALRELVRRDFVRPLPGVARAPEFAFWHALVRDVAYAQLPRPVRIARHEAMARWLLDRPGDRSAAEPSAHHYVTAHDLSLAAGRSPGDVAQLAARAAETLVAAARHAVRLDVRRAKAHLTRALALVPDGTALQATVLARLGDVAMDVGNVDEAGPLYEAAVPLFRANDQPLDAGDTLVRLWRALRDRAELERGREVLREGVALLEQGPESAALANGYSQIAFDIFTAGHGADCIPWAAKAIDIARRVDAPEVIVPALQYQGFARVHTGEPASVDDMRAAVDFAAARGLLREYGIAANNLALTEWLVVSPHAALVTCDAALAAVRGKGVTEVDMLLRDMMVGPFHDLGRWDDLEAASAAVLEWARGGGSVYDTVATAPYVALAHLRRGRVERARVLAERFVPDARKVVSLDVVTPAMTAGVLVAAFDGSASTVRLLVEELIAAAEQQGPFWIQPHLTDLVRSCVAVGETELAEAVLAFPMAPVLRLQHARVAGAAAVAEARGDHEAAAAGYRAAAEGWHDYGHVLEHGYALLGLARCALRLGDVPTAQVSSAQAREVLGAVDAWPGDDGPITSHAAQGRADAS